MSIDLIKENCFTLSRWYPTETITEADFTDDLALLKNTPTQAEFLLPNLEQAAEDIGLYEDANKTDSMSF